MSSLSNQEQKIANKVLRLYMPIHGRMLRESSLNRERKNKAMAKFIEWASNYARTARNPTNQNIHKAYMNKFH